MSRQVIAALVAYGLFSAVAGAMLPPLEGQERTWYGFAWRFIQSIAMNTHRLVDSGVAGKLTHLSASAQSTTAKAEENTMRSTLVVLTLALYTCYLLVFHDGRPGPLFIALGTMILVRFLPVRRRPLGCLLLLLFLLPAAGCKTLTAAPTPGVPQFYSQAALEMADFSGVLLKAQVLFANAHTTGLVSDADFQNGMQTFAKIATNGDAINTMISTEASQSTIIAAITALVGQIGAMPSTFAIKDPSAQSSFTALCVSLQQILQATSTAVQSTATSAPVGPGPDPTGPPGAIG